MDQMTQENVTTEYDENHEKSGHIRHLVFVHLTRLGLLVLAVIAITVLTVIIRHLTSSAGFILQQQINVISVIAGLVVVAIVYILGIKRMLRNMRQWEQQGKTALATGATWSLGITAFILALPLVLVFLIH